VAVALAQEARGNRERAVALVEEYGHVTEDRRGFLAQNLTDAVRICVPAGNLAVAERLLSGVRRAAARHAASAATCDAVLAEARGELSDAVDLYADAAVRWAGFPSPLEQGLALLGRGRCLIATGRTGEAKAELEQARALFSGLRARPLVSALDDLIAGTAAVNN